MITAENERILIVDDDQSLGATLAELLRDNGFAADAISEPEKIDHVLETGLYDLAIVDLRMPGMSGQQVVRRIRETDPAIAVIMLTAYGTVNDVIDAFRAGVVDFLIKPATGEQILEVVRCGLLRTKLARRARPTASHSDSDPFACILGDDAVLRQQIEEARLAAKQECAVLILGETGCGKDLLAEAIHRASMRADGPFLTTVVGARPETLVQGELFGHVKAAYTGAEHAAHGLIKDAHEGTLFLDEIGDVSAPTQLALLRTIEKKCVQPLGASHEVRVDVRFLSATNRDLEAEVEAGRFRRDLYYRLSEFTIRLPPLRQRRRDIPMLIWHFATLAVGEASVLPAFTDDAIAKLTSHDWPGNVRELKAEVTRAVYRCQQAEVTAADCLVNTRPSAAAHRGDFTLPLKEAQDQFTTAYLRHWLKRTNGNSSEVGRHAGVHPQSVRRLLRKHHLRENSGE